MDMFDIVRYLRAQLGKSERGAVLVEYALLLMPIAVVCIVVLSAIGGQTNSKFASIGSSMG